MFLLCRYKARGWGARAAQAARDGRLSGCFHGRGELGGKQPDKPERAVDVCLASFKGGKTAVWLQFNLEFAATRNIFSVFNLL